MNIIFNCEKVVPSNGLVNIKCHHDDQGFRNKCYAAVRLLLDGERQELPLSDFIMLFNDKFNESLNERIVKAMKHAVEVSKFKNYCEKFKQIVTNVYNAV